jgi:hypothetical protein
MKKYEVRCHEWGDDSDYHRGYFNSREEAQKFIDDFYEPDPLAETYEKLYIIELESKL